MTAPELSPGAVSNLIHTKSNTAKVGAETATVDGLMREMDITEASIALRKQLVGLSADDIRIVLSVRKEILPTVDENTRAFFDYIAHYEGGKRLFSDPALLARAKRMKGEHLRAMLQGEYGREYVRQRIELALVYSVGDLDLKVFVGAFHDLMRRLGEQIMAARLGNAMEGFRAFMAIKKVAFFDLTLMTDVMIFQRELTIRRIGQEASQYARSLIEAALDPLVMISPDGKITDENEATTKVTGVERERLIGTDFAEYFTQPEKAREAYKRAFLEGSITDYPLALRHASGRITDVLYNANVYKDTGGNVLGVAASARDITAQKQA
ncbi:MAG: protoglobin family protein, partial [Thermoplasmatota archaeon]